MHWYDYLVIAIILVLFIIVLIYLIKNKGCPSSTCKTCQKYPNCHKNKKDITNSYKE